MHRLRRRPLRWALVVAAAGLSAVAACSQSDSGSKPASSSTRPSRVTSSPPAGAIGLSPSGVTTKVDVPAESTEEEYFQACHAAKVWMETQSTAGQSAVEPYLAMVQASASGVAGTWNIRWADLSQARQAGVIVAAVAAANNECG